MLLETYGIAKAVNCDEKVPICGTNGLKLKEGVMFNLIQECRVLLRERKFDVFLELANKGAKSRLSDDSFGKFIEMHLYPGMSMFDICTNVDNMLCALEYGSERIED